MSERENPGLQEARRLAEAKKKGLLRVPDGRDVPSARPFPGRKPVVLPGQLALGQEAGEEPAA